MEKILSITECSFSTREYYNYDGYIVKTNLQEIKVGIDNRQSCCEAWGEFMSEDDLSSYIGARLINVYVSDTGLKDYDLEDMYDGSCMFVTFETDKGAFQFVAYNIHNGYYGHEAVFITKDLNHSETL